MQTCTDSKTYYSQKKKKRLPIATKVSPNASHRNRISLRLTPGNHWEKFSSCSTHGSTRWPDAVTEARESHKFKLGQPTAQPISQPLFVPDLTAFRSSYQNCSARNQLSMPIQPAFQWICHRIGSTD